MRIKAFKGYRPSPGLEDKIACKPYDVINHEEALGLGRHNPVSFVHVIRPEIDMPLDTAPYSKAVYEKARDRLDEFIEKGYLVEEDREALFIYRQEMNGRSQTGIVGCNPIDDYGEARIKRHEHTRFDKEEDRTRHFNMTGAHTEPVFLFYKKDQGIKNFIDDFTKQHNPVYDFLSEDGVRQLVWIIADDEKILEIQRLFSKIDKLYIADGHHRTASSYKLGLKKREANPSYTGEEAFNFFLSVIFSHDELYIMPYNRMIRDLNTYSEGEFLERVKENFYIEEIPSIEEPRVKGEITMLLRESYYRLRPRAGTYNGNDPIDSLDVSILQKNLLAPILHIEDPRTNDRIEFVGGENMIDRICSGLEKETIKVAFLLYPTRTEDIMDVSHIGGIMPPKSTWFDPKLMSGLFIHKL